MARHITLPKLVSFLYSSNNYESALVWCAFTEYIYVWRQTQKVLTYKTRAIKSGFHLQNLRYLYNKKETLLLVAKGINCRMFKTL
jgi:hypothetical protein